MAPSSPLDNASRETGNTLHPVDWYQRLMLSKTLTSCPNQAKYQQRNCGNKFKNLATAPRPFLVSRRILGSSSGETFLNKSRSAGCRGHSLRTCSTVSSWPHSQLWFRSSMPLVRKYFPRTPWPVRSWNNLLKVWRDTLLMKDFSGLGYFPP